MLFSNSSDGKLSQTKSFCRGAKKVPVKDAREKEQK